MSDHCYHVIATPSRRREANKHTTVRGRHLAHPRNRPLAAMFITAQRDCLRRCTVGARGGPRDATAAHDRQPTAASALPEALPIPGALLPRTRDASTIEQRRVFVSVAALYSMRCLTACGRVILGCSGGRSDDRAMSDGCRGRSGYVRNVRRNYVAERRDY